MGPILTCFGVKMIDTSCCRQVTVERAGERSLEFENLDEQHLEITLRKGSLSIGVFSKMVSDTSSVQFAQLFFTSDSGHA